LERFRGPESVLALRDRHCRRTQDIVLDAVAMADDADDEAVLFG
jgi:hypothetical protein